MLKKILIYIAFLIFVISCDAQIARNQFENGEYRQSVKTTLRIAAYGKYNSLNKNEKEELINRVKIIDRYYMQLNNSSNIQDIYDAFAIGYMINSKLNNLSPYVNYLTINNTDRLANKLEEKINETLHYSSTEYDLKCILNIQKDMNELRLINSKYKSLYKTISKNLADIYYILANNTKNEEDELKYLKITYTTYKDFDSNYKQSKTRYLILEKSIDIKNAKLLTNDAKNEYYFENYNKALEKFNKALKLYEKYSDYSFEARDVKEYIENISRKIKEKEAQKYFNLGLYYRSKRDYINASKAFYKAHNIISDYKSSYKLAKECERNII